MIGRTIGRFRVVSQLGQGGIATVWRAEDILLGRTVALKILDEKLAQSPKARRRFLHEAQSAAALDHPGITTVHDYGDTGGIAYIALSLVDGETLSELASRRLLPIETAVNVVRLAADALAHAHARGVMHRDVTGRNIMVARDGRVFLLDFGLALAAWESRVTTTEVAMGTAPYMAPEVIQAATADARSDVYSLGVVLYEALTGAFPFPGDHLQAVFYAATNCAPVPLTSRRLDVPEPLEAIVLRCLDRYPDARFQSATELTDALATVVLGSAPPHPLRPVPPGFPRSLAAVSPDAVTAPARGREDGPLYLAVLPFDAAPASSEAENACSTLARRLPELLSCALAQAPGIRVVPPSAADGQLEPRELARQLGAQMLLRGSVHGSGTRVRVSYALVDPWRGIQEGGDVVDGSALRLFDLEDDVVTSVRAALRVPRSVQTRPARPPDPAANEHYRQALGYLKRYDNEASVDGAIALLERLVESEGDVAIYHSALARAFLHKQQLTKERNWERRAAAACHRALVLDPDAPEVRIAAGFLMLSTGRHAEARVEFEAALGRQPDLLDARLGIARALADAGDFPAAEAVCTATIEQSPDDWRGHSLLGWVRFRARRYEEALGPWQRVVDLTPDNARGRRNLGTALYRLDRHQAAVEAYEASLAIQPSDEAYSNLGAALYVLGRYEDSIVAFRKAVALTTTDPLRWGNLGVACRWIQGHEEESRVPLERGVALMREQLERNPSRADWWALMGGWLSALGRNDEALDAIARAISLDAEDAECMLRAGHTYFQAGQPDEALRWFRKAKAAGCGLGELRHSPALASLRHDPEFIRLVESEPVSQSASSKEGRP